ncbi:MULTISPECIES: TetR/AcrR family transcriptional regulator [unclassified Microbacterium]|uniref:TetR/AcrR family transcriptional regulator n=1 Tax=unclassified Microbacterium TaxID=2609290 RepID=UPI0034140792
MPRPRQFDTQTALRSAARAFWRHGYAGTSTEALLDEMKIGRQSLYNAFGDKRQLYLDALRLYSSESVSAHVARLEGPEAPVDGLRELLRGLAVDDDDDRARGCFGVAATIEFGASDEAIAAATRGPAALLHARIRERLALAVADGSLDADIDLEASAVLVEQQMIALQVAARSGASVHSMRSAADYAIDQL